MCTEAYDSCDQESSLAGSRYSHTEFQCRILRYSELRHFWFSVAVQGYTATLTPRGMALK